MRRVCLSVMVLYSWQNIICGVFEDFVSRVSFPAVALDESRISGDDGPCPSSIRTIMSLSLSF